MTTRQSSTVSQSLMDLAPSTPIASVPVPADPTVIVDDLTLRIAVSAAEEGTLERDPAGKWVGVLRRISTAKLRAWGLESITEEAELLVSELATNALRYGEDGQIEFRLVVTLQLVLIAVNDGSPHRPQLKSVDDVSEAGRGLFLVSAYAADWGVSDDGMTTWCTVATPKDR